MCHSTIYHFKETNILLVKVALDIFSIHYLEEEKIEVSGDLA